MIPTGDRACALHVVAADASETLATQREIKPPVIVTTATTA
jgi:hypothetical protein